MSISENVIAFKIFFVRVFTRFSMDGSVIRKGFVHSEMNNAVRMTPKMSNTEGKKHGLVDKYKINKKYYDQIFLHNTTILYNMLTTVAGTL